MMDYNTSLRMIYKRFKAWFSTNLEPSEQEIKDWLKWSFIQGRISMGEDPNEYIESKRDDNTREPAMGMD